MKFADIQAKANQKNPNTTLDIELNGEEVSVTLRNVLRLTEEESAQVSEALAVMNASEDEIDELLTEEERKLSVSRLIAARLSTALQAVAEEKELFDQFLDGLRNTGDFNMWMVELFSAYAEETRLGEASASDGS